MAQELMVLKPELQKSTGDNVIGFPDLISQQKQDASFAPIALQNGFKAMAGGSGGGTRNAPEGNVTALFGELQAASELSLDELAKQTELLEDIKDNTDPKVDTAGGQKPPKTEEQIKKKLEGDDKPIDEEQGNKIIKLLSESNGSAANLMTFMGALGGSIAAQNMTGDELVGVITKSLAGLGLLGAASMYGKGRMLSRVVSPPTNQTVPDKENKNNNRQRGGNRPPTTRTPTGTGGPRPAQLPPPRTTTPATSVARNAGGRTLTGIGTRLAARTAATAASGPAAAIVGTIAGAATIYELGAFGLEQMGYGDEVEAFETGVMNLIGVETDEQEAEKDAAKIAMNTKKFNALVPQIMNDDSLDEDQKKKAIAKLEESLMNSGDVDAFGDAAARNADRTFAKFERQYGEVDLSKDYAAPPPMSADQIEGNTDQAKMSEALSLQPIVNVPEQPAPNVNVPTPPTPNINVSAILPRVNLPRDLFLTGSQSKLPKFVVE